MGPSRILNHFHFSTFLYRLLRLWSHTILLKSKTALLIMRSQRASKWNESVFCSLKIVAPLGILPGQKYLPFSGQVPQQCAQPEFMTISRSCPQKLTVEACTTALALLIRIITKKQFVLSQLDEISLKVTKANAV
jgi:hypothetical protein